MSYLRRVLREVGEWGQRVKNPWPEAQRLLFQFKTSEDLAEWQAYADSELGGQSTAELRLSESSPGTAEFSGRFSTVRGEGAHERLKRSGYAGFRLRTRDQHDLVDIEDFDSLVFRIKSDGRKYIASVRCESWLVDESSHDVWQAFLFARKGEWEEVEVPLSRFLLTWKGKVVEEVVELNPKRITSVGISLAGGQKEGDYCLGVDWIAARNNNGLQDADQREQ